MARNGAYWRPLDGLRGVAVLAVLAFHGGIPGFTGGFLGVDVFFTLSGFLITGLLIDEYARAGRINLGRFWGRRLRRLIPALVLVVLGVALYGAFGATATQRSQLPDQGLAALGYFTNWREISTGVGYFASTSAPSPLLHTWSLGIEEQWYLIWPLALFALCWALRGTRQRLRILAGVCAAAAVGATVLMAVLAETDGIGRAYYGTDTRAGSLLVGAALACLVARRSSTRTGRRSSHMPSTQVLFIVSSVAFVALGAAMMLVDHEDPRLYRGGFLACSVATIAIILACIHPMRNPVAAVLSTGSLVWIGVISYGLYLWHWPVFLMLTPDRTGLALWPLFVVRVAVSVLIAWASFVLVERPIRAGHWKPSRWIPSFAAVGAAALVALILVNSLQPTFALADPSKIHDAKRRAAREAVAGAPSFLFAGDSIAFSLMYGFAGWAVETHLATLDSEFGLGCGIIDGPRIRAGVPASSPRECDGWLQRWHDKAVASSADVSLLVLSVWDLQDRSLDDGATTLPPTSPQIDALYEQQLHRAVVALSAGGATVGLVTLPVLSNEEARAAGLTGEIREEQPVVIDHYNELLRRYARTHPGSFVVDLARHLHGSTIHPTTYHGLRLFGDGVHFDTPAAKELAPWIFAQSERVLAASRSPGG